MRPLLVLIAWLLAMPCVAVGPAGVNASVSPSGVKVQAAIRVAASLPVLWETLTDYNHLQEFIPDMRVSRIISKPGQAKVVEQISDAGMFALVVPEHVILAMEETPTERIRFRAIGGAVSSLAGEWSMVGPASEQERFVLLYYRVHMVPLLPVPMTLPSTLVEREVRVRMEAVAAEAERRMRATVKN
jgi:hypothetical protein